MRNNNQTKHQSLKLAKLNFAIPLMAIAGLGTIGIFTINQDVGPNASASNSSTLTGTISYEDQYITISNNSVINLGSAAVTIGAQYLYATDNVTVSTNVETGYDLYISSGNNESSALTTDGSYTAITATSGTGGDGGMPAVLDDNTYGYALPNSLATNSNFDADYSSPTSTSKWAAVPAGTSDRIHSTNAANESGDTVDVHYGASITNYLSEGQYTGTIVYSALVTPAGTLTPTVSPTSGAGGTILTITSGPENTINTSGSLDPSEVEIYFRQSGKTKGSCEIIKANPSSGHLVTTCKVPTIIAGTYDVVINVPRFGYTDTISGGFTSTSVAASLNTTMQNPNIASICAGLSETTSTSNAPTYEITDSRNSEPYFIRKFTFGSNKYCMMVENLYLTDNVKLTINDTDIANSFNLPTSTSAGFSSSDRNPQMNNGVRYRYINNNSYDGSYYNWCAATAGTGGCYGLATNGSTASGEQASGSICPKGWRLPTYVEQQSIYSSISNANVNTFFASTNGTTNTPIQVGYYARSVFTNGDTSTLWQSSTQIDAYSAYNLRIYTGSFSTNNADKYFGLSVRCLVQASS